MNALTRHQRTYRDEQERAYYRKVDGWMEAAWQVAEYIGYVALVCATAYLAWDAIAGQL